MFKKGQKVVAMPREGSVQANGFVLLSGDTAIVDAVHGDLVTVHVFRNTTQTATLKTTEVRPA